MNFYKKLGEIRPNQLITTYGPGSIMDAVNDSLTVLDIIYINLLTLIDKEKNKWIIGITS